MTWDSLEIWKPTGTNVKAGGTENDDNIYFMDDIYGTYDPKW